MFAPGLKINMPKTKQNKSKQNKTIRMFPNVENVIIKANKV